MTLLAVFWLAVSTTCHGGPLLSPIDHYEVVVFEARVTGYITYPDNGDLMPVYLKTFRHSTAGPVTTLALEPEVGSVVGWDGMSEGLPPLVHAVTVAGVSSEVVCQ